MDYITKKIFEHLFGNDRVLLGSPVVGVSHPRKKYQISLKGVKQKDITTILWRFRQKKLLDIVEDGDKLRITLTETGRKKILSYNLENLDIHKPKCWDSKWRIVAFDIPETKKAARNALGQKLRDLGLLPFQKSLWIHPYECKDEIDFIAEVFEVGKYVHYIVTDNMTNDSLIRDRFGL